MFISVTELTYQTSRSSTIRAAAISRPAPSRCSNVMLALAISGAMDPRAAQPAEAGMSLAAPALAAGPRTHQTAPGTRCSRFAAAAALWGPVQARLGAGLARLALPVEGTRRVLRHDRHLDRRRLPLGTSCSPSAGEPLCGAALVRHRPHRDRAATPQIMVIFWIYFTIRRSPATRCRHGPARRGADAHLRRLSRRGDPRRPLVDTARPGGKCPEVIVLGRLQIFAFVLLPPGLRNMLPAFITTS